MTVDASDIQGAIAVGTDFTASKYELRGNREICLAAAIGRSFNFHSGQIQSNVESLAAGFGSKVSYSKVNGNIRTNSLLSLTNTTVTGTVHTSSGVIKSNATAKVTTTRKVDGRVNFDTLKRELGDVVQKWSSQPDNTRFENENGVLKIVAKEENSIVHLSNVTLEYKNFHTIDIVAAGAQKVVLVFTERVVNLEHLDVRIAGINSKNIIWVFPNAEQLNINYVADPVYGLPGLFLAPYAELSFYEGLITGGVYVRSWIDDGVPGKKSGQVNDAIPVPKPLN